MIRVTDLSISFENTLALKRFSFEFNDGVIYGVLGRNGAGKSTLLRGLTGLISVYGGNVSYNEIDMQRNRHKIKESFSYVPEEAVLLPYLTGREYLELISIIRNLPQASTEIDELMTNLGLKDSQHELAGEYSHGMQKKLSLAAALLGSPQHILIDEGLNGLDPQGLEYATRRIKIIAERKHLIIFASHDFDLVYKICGHIIMLHEGRLIRELSAEDMKSLAIHNGDSLRREFINLLKNHPG